tara:strand:- start:60805 stop:61881 length:1077 start_codon:yes stop_codon:yes gene_type:complete
VAFDYKTHTLDASSGLSDNIIKAQHAAVDTEFIRQSTYYPKVGLIQLATRDDSYVFDPMDSGIECLRSFLLNRSIAKIMHASRQDIDIFVHQLRIVPAPLIDTQILAEFCGFEANISLDALSQHFFEMSLDKSYQRLNWLKRPLPAKALVYAHEDVQVTYRCFEKLQEMADHKYAWFLEDMAEMEKPTFYQETPESLFKKFKKQTRSLTSAQAVVLKRILVIRDLVAAKLNRAVRYILEDDVCMEICQSDLAKQKMSEVMKGLTEKFHEVKKADFLDWNEGIIDEVFKREISAPEKEEGNINKNHVQELQQKLAVTAEQNQITPSLLARKRDIIEALRDFPTSRLSKGWRAPLVQSLF